MTGKPPPGISNTGRHPTLFDQQRTVGGTLGVTGNTTLKGTLSSGAATLASVAVTNGATVGGTLGVTGNTTLKGTLSSGAATLDAAVTNGATVGGTLGVTGKPPSRALEQRHPASASVTGTLG